MMMELTCVRISAPKILLYAMYDIILNVIKLFYYYLK